MAKPILLLLFLLPVLGLVVGLEMSQCTPNMVIERMKKCTPRLSSIANQILASDGKNFSQACREFIKFTFCVEKDLYGCHPLLLRRYRAIKHTYMRPPYRCQDPFSLATFRFDPSDTKLTIAQGLLSPLHHAESRTRHSENEITADDVMREQTLADAAQAPEQRSMYLRTVSLMIRSMIRTLVG